MTPSVSSHPDDLLAVYALDAVDPAEAEAVERHLRDCPRCQAEVDGYRDTAAALGMVPGVTLDDAPPPSLWDRIAAGLADPTPIVPPPAVLDPLGPASTGPAPTSPASAGPASAGPVSPASVRRRRVGWWATAAVAVAATVVAVVLGVNLTRANDQLNRAHEALSAGAEAALRQPGHLVVYLDSPADTRLAELVLTPGGRGYLLSSSMPRLAGHETYQLWGIIDGRAISLGLMGADPRYATFTVAGSTTPSALAVTVEPAGGVITPTENPIASGHVA